jgi:uncharacterized membrane protein
MPVDVTVETVINRPRDQVAAFVMDPANDMKWISALKEVRLLTPPPIGVGARVERIAAFMGRSVQYVLEITGYQPGRFLDMKSVKGPFPMRASYQFEDRDSGTLVRVKAHGEAGGVYRFAGPMLAQSVKRHMAGDLERLKQVIENDALNSATKES